ncbi:MAG: hypothetical protein ACRYG8_44135 [Janthinobacterium lividum]
MTDTHTPVTTEGASYWTYQAPPTPLEGPPGFSGDWSSLSPGMRREIWRSIPTDRPLDPQL